MWPLSKNSALPGVPSWLQAWLHASGIYHQNVFTYTIYHQDIFRKQTFFSVFERLAMSRPCSSRCIIGHRSTENIFIFVFASDNRSLHGVSPVKSCLSNFSFMAGLKKDADKKAGCSITKIREATVCLLNYALLACTTFPLYVLPSDICWTRIE